MRRSRAQLASKPGGFMTSMQLDSRSKRDVGRSSQSAASGRLSGRPFAAWTGGVLMLGRRSRRSLGLVSITVRTASKGSASSLPTLAAKVNCRRLCQRLVLLRQEKVDLGLEPLLVGRVEGHWNYKPRATPSWEPNWDAIVSRFVLFQRSTERCV